MGEMEVVTYCGAAACALGTPTSTDAPIIATTPSDAKNFWILFTVDNLREPPHLGMVTGRRRSKSVGMTQIDDLILILNQVVVRFRSGQ